MPTDSAECQNISTFTLKVSVLVMSHYEQLLTSTAGLGPLGSSQQIWFQPDRFTESGKPLVERPVLHWANGLSIELRPNTQS